MYGFQSLGCLDFPFIDALLLGYISPPFSPFVSGEIQKAKPLGEICMCWFSSVVDFEFAVLVSL